VARVAPGSAFARTGRCRPSRCRPMWLLGRGHGPGVHCPLLGRSFSSSRASHRHDCASSMSSNGEPRSVFLDEVWLTPLQIARQFGYATDKPVRKAIMRGDLRATRAPCGRKLIVAETEVLRWVRRTLAFEPLAASPEESRPPTPTTHRGRRTAMPRLSYEASRTLSG
jgi:hypothetical protein